MFTNSKNAREIALQYVAKKNALNKERLDTAHEYGLLVKIH